MAINCPLADLQHVGSRQAGAAASRTLARQRVIDSDQAHPHSCPPRNGGQPAAKEVAAPG
jgi:hypothetical protein